MTDIKADLETLGVRMDVYSSERALLESGAVKPIVHATFPLRAAADAHRLLESSLHIGKIVLVTS